MSLTRPAVALAASAMVATVLAVGGPAHAADPLSPATTFTMTVHQDGTVATPTDGAAIPNIDSVKSTLRAYYGATKGTDPAYVYATDGKDGDDNSAVPQTTNLPNLVSSPYAKNTEAIAANLVSSLRAKPAADAAIVFDVDSTLLSDYANEEDTNFNYSPSVNALWVNHELFPAVAGMVDALKTLHSEGYAIYGITGRPSSQEDATIANLTKVGYTSDGTANGTALFDTNNLFTKWDTSVPTAKPPYIGTCTLSTTCNTVEYKANTRKHIEQDLGKHIVMNVGDQWSDLEGGYADATQKLPNPSYFLPAADIPGAPGTDTAMVLRTTYTMAPDGSSGATATNGDAIPNEGAVVSEIRAYYKATGGIADKTSSPYITQLNALEASWTPKIATSCQQAVARTARAHAAAVKAGAALTGDAKALAKARKHVKHAKKHLMQAKRHHRATSPVVKRKHKQLKQARHARTRAHAFLDRDRSLVAAGRQAKDPAVVFDADDTTLWTYDMEDGDPKAAHAGMQFNFNPTLQNSWVQNEWFPATPGMPALVKAVAAAGCTVVGLTGRTTDQQAATIDNLTKDGYVDAAGKPLFTAANYYTKWKSPAAPPAYITCVDRTKCTTIEYKSGTRRFLETQRGLDVVANLGDQFSDLKGGSADSTYKLPNPTYYLP